jgi:hypothetical protein
MTKFNPEEIKTKQGLPCIISWYCFHLIVNPDSVNLKDKNFDFTHLRSKYLLR